MADVKKVATKNILPEDIFGLEVKNHELLKLAYNRYLANARNAHPNSKDRGDVRGGGKKPWRQKGTGRARFGSSRNPIWRGGGVAFGPQGNENHIIKISTSSKRLAVKQALSIANLDGRITVINSFDCPTGKVKETMSVLASNKVNDLDRVLLVINNKDDLILRATKNVQQLKVVKPTYLNVFDVLNADKILICKESISLIANWLTKGAK